VVEETVAAAANCAATAAPGAGVRIADESAGSGHRPLSIPARRGGNVAVVTGTAAAS